ncbi:DUF3311 domain-containing protein [Pirellulaceae bacterium SH449]
MMRNGVWILFVVLFVLHHDFWWWNDSTMVLGILPIGLAWHAGFSIAASVFWVLAIRYAWPSEVERWAEEADNSDSPRT